MFKFSKLDKIFCVRNLLLGGFIALSPWLLFGCNDSSKSSVVGDATEVVDDADNAMQKMYSDTPVGDSSKPDTGYANGSSSTQDAPASDDQSSPTSDDSSAADDSAAADSSSDASSDDSTPNGPSDVDSSDSVDSSDDASQGTNSDDSTQSDDSDDDDNDGSVS